jgi:hypothetical protein
MRPFSYAAFFTLVLSCARFDDEPELAPPESAALALAEPDRTFACEPRVAGAPAVGKAIAARNHDAVSCTFELSCPRSFRRHEGSQGCPEPQAWVDDYCSMLGGSTGLLGTLAGPVVVRAVLPDDGPAATEQFCAAVTEAYATPAACEALFRGTGSAFAAAAVANTHRPQAVATDNAASLGHGADIRPESCERMRNWWETYKRAR